MSSTIPSLDEVDQDGGIREASEAVDAADGETRRAFLRKAGIGAGVVLGAAALPSLAFAGGETTRRATSRFSTTRSTLEYLEAAFYTQSREESRER